MTGTGHLCHRCSSADCHADKGWRFVWVSEPSVQDPDDGEYEVYCSSVCETRAKRERERKRQRSA